VIDPTATEIEIVRVAEMVDPAIDETTSDLKTYAKTRNPAALKFKPGQRPVLFKLRELSATFVGEELDGLEWNKRALLAFRAACHAITLADGKALAPVAKDVEEHAAHGVRVAGKEWVERVAKKIGMKSVYEAGSVAIRRAHLAEDEMGPFVWPDGPAPTP
jgi:hypothetical protein